MNASEQPNVHNEELPYEGSFPVEHFAAIEREASKYKIIFDEIRREGESYQRTLSSGQTQTYIVRPREVWVRFRSPNIDANFWHNVRSQRPRGA